MKNYKFLAWTRENILTYTYNAAVIAHETGVPIVRSMPVSFPGQRSLAAVGDQYMFGDDLLVAPVLTDDTARTIVFPAGVWTGLWDGKTVCGPAELKVSAPLDTIPVYLRPGAVVPVQLNRDLRFGASMTAGRVSALVVTPTGRKETVSLLNAEGKTAKVTVNSRRQGCRWTLETFPETSYSLVYGVGSAKRIRVDGKVIPQVQEVPFSAMPVGWQADQAGNRLVIRVPSAKAERNRPTTVLELEY